MKENQQKKLKLNSIFSLLFCGAGIGSVNGIFGGGGGMIAVPLLHSTLSLPPKKAHATAILVILPICAASLIVYFFSGEFSFSIAIPVSIGVTLGGFIGAKLLKALSSGWICIVFAIIMLAAGIRMLF